MSHYLVAVLHRKDQSVENLLAPISSSPEKQEPEKQPSYTI